MKQERPSKHFSYEEFGCKDGTPVPQELRGNVNYLCSALEVVRYALGGPSVRINSGYRTPEHNTRIGGSKNSEHLKARAGDLDVEGIHPHVVHAKIEELITIGAIPEGGLGKYDTFTHYDVRGTRARW